MSVHEWSFSFLDVEVGEVSGLTWPVEVVSTSFTTFQFTMCLMQ